MLRKIGEIRIRRVSIKFSSCFQFFDVFRKNAPSDYYNWLSAKLRACPHVSVLIDSVTNVVRLNLPCARDKTKLA